MALLLLWLLLLLLLLLLLDVWLLAESVAEQACARIALRRGVAEEIRCCRCRGLCVCVCVCVCACVRACASRSAACIPACVCRPAAFRTRSFAQTCAYSLFIHAPVCIVHSVELNCTSAYYLNANMEM